MQTDDQKITYFLGEGLLADSACEALRRSQHVVRLGTPGAEQPCRGVPGCMLVSAYDTWCPEREHGIHQSALRSGIPWLPIRTELSAVVIGPTTYPNRAGCFACAETRRRVTATHIGRREALLERYAERLAASPPGTLTAMAREVAGAIMIDELASCDAARMRTSCGLIILDTNTLAVEIHRFLPDAVCSNCGAMPGDSREAACIDLEPRPKRTAESYRTRDLTAELDELAETYVDPEVGIIRDLRLIGRATFPAVEAPVGFPGQQRSDAGYGRSFDVRTGKATALAEALERLGGWSPDGKRSTIWGTYRELRGEALDPRRLGLPAPTDPPEPNSGFQAYHDELPLMWVWGFSFRARRPILVPESIAYYGAPRWRTGHEPRFAYEVSNGCALGCCLEEAILFGALEVAERDSFLLSWLARLPVPRIDPKSARSRQLALMVEKLTYKTGYDVAIFNTTLEQRIPSFWVMAIDRTGRQERPKTISTGGSNPHPEQAVISALLELGLMIDALPGSYRANRELVRNMVAQSAAVTEMAHHVLLYCEPATFERFEFLFANPEQRSFDDFADVWQWPVHDDVTEDAREIVSRYLATDLDIIVVDQSGPVHERGGFACVKVIVPGTVPMTFGHENRRLAGLPRLLSLPQQLGYRDRLLTLGDVNPYPHPFP